MGDVAVRVDEAYAHLALVHRQIFDLVADRARLPADRAEKEWWTVDELAGRGFFLTFDVVGLILTLDLDPGLRLVQTHALSAAHAQGEVTAVSEAFSGGVNLYGRSAYERLGGEAGTEPTVDFLGRAEPFLNARGWVLEGAVHYDTTEPTPLELTEYRLVRDLLPQKARFEAGTLRHPTIEGQGRRDILGVGLSRRFELDPTLDPRRNTAAFFLDRGDEVNVFLNGRNVFSERLAAGPHVLEGLALSPGRNELSVEAGGETQVLIIPHDADLLRPGLADYAAAVGVLKDDASAPAASGFYRRGFTEEWSAGAFTHLDPEGQMTGLESVNAFPFGSIQSTAAASRAILGAGEGDDRRWGFRGSLTYRLTLQRSMVSSLLLSGSLLSRYFSSAGPLEAGNRYFGDAVSSLGVRFGQNALASFGLRGRFAAGADDVLSLSVSGRTSFSRSLQLFVGLRFDLAGDEADGLQSTVTLTYFPRRWPNFRSAATQTIGDTASSVELSGEGKEPGSAFRWSAAAAATPEADRPYRVDGSARYGGNRGEVQVQGYGAGGADESGYRLEGGGETALLFAGNVFAIGRPVNDSFVLVRTHESMGDAIVGVRTGDTWRERTGALGPAAIGGLTSYRFQRIDLDAERVPADVDTGDLSRLLFPSYRSGYAVTVGKGAAVYAGGVLAGPDGEPLALAPLEARAADGTATIRFFTDESGMFEVYGLQPGRWELVSPKDGARALLEVPGDAAGYLDLGSMRMERP